jgi:hypothetical protein
MTDNRYDRFEAAFATCLFDMAIIRPSRIKVVPCSQTRYNKATPGMFHPDAAGMKRQWGIWDYWLITVEAV